VAVVLGGSTARVPWERGAPGPGRDARRRRHRGGCRGRPRGFGEHHRDEFGVEHRLVGRRLVVHPQRLRLGQASASRTSEPVAGLCDAFEVGAADLGVEHVDGHLNTSSGQDRPGFSVLTTSDYLQP
jgi:hypothetical protein